MGSDSGSRATDGDHGTCRMFRHIVTFVLLLPDLHLPTSCLPPPLYSPSRLYPTLHYASSACSTACEHSQQPPSSEISKRKRTTPLCLHAQSAGEHRDQASTRREQSRDEDGNNKRASERGKREADPSAAPGEHERGLRGAYLNQRGPRCVVTHLRNATHTNCHICGPFSRARQARQSTRYSMSSRSSQAREHARRMTTVPRAPSMTPRTKVCRLSNNCIPIYSQIV